MTRGRVPSPGATRAPGLEARDDGSGEHAIPAGLVDARRRIVTSRTAAARSLERAARRRRVLPGVLVGTLALAGAGIADAAVQRSVPGTAQRSTSAAAIASAAATSKPSTADSGLTAARRALVLDRAAIADLERVAAAVGAAAASASPRAGAQPAGSAATVPATTLAPLATLPPLPAAAAAPPTHATTGASGAG